MRQEYFFNTLLSEIAKFYSSEPVMPNSTLQRFYESVILTTDVSKKPVYNKVALVCSYFEQPFFSSGHKHLFASLKALGYWVLCVHSVPERTMKLQRPAETDGLLVKRNSGYDFGSWLTGIYYLRRHLPELEQLVLVNDSNIGPLTDLAPIFAKMNASPCDFWGLTDSFQHAYHLQSYFFVFKKKVLSSGFFEQFGATFSYPNDRRTVIEEGELYLTKKLMREGFIPGVAFKYEDVARHWLAKWQSAKSTQPLFRTATTAGNSEGMTALLAEYIDMVKKGTPMNPTHLFWDSLIEMGFPFLKRELLFQNPMNMPNIHAYKKIIADNCQNFPIDQIEDTCRFFPVDKIYL